MERAAARWVSGWVGEESDHALLVFGCRGAVSLRRDW
jgi:hypothetical protein